MSETNKGNSHWLTKLAVIGGSAIISAFGSAFISLLILVGLRGGIDSSVGGLFLFPIGFLAGGGIAMRFLGKQIPIWKVIGVSILMALLASSLLTIGLYLLDWI